MSPATTALTHFKPRMARHHSSAWNNVKKYEDFTIWLPQAREEISQLEGLGNNWDSYGSKPVQAVAIKNAIRFLFEAPSQFVPAPHISPTPGGGVGFHWQIAGRDLEIEFTPNGAIEFLKSHINGDHDPDEGIIENSNGYSILKWVAGLM
jgi:hypothetical protein